MISFSSRVGWLLQFYLWFATFCHPKKKIKKWLKKGPHKPTSLLEKLWKMLLEVDLWGPFFYYLFWRARPTGKLWKNASWLCCLFVWPFAADNENIWVVWCSWTVQFYIPIVFRMYIQQWLVVVLGVLHHHFASSVSNWGKARVCLVAKT